MRIIGYRRWTVGYTGWVGIDIEGPKVPNSFVIVKMRADCGQVINKVLAYIGLIVKVHGFMDPHSGHFLRFQMHNWIG